MNVLGLRGPPVVDRKRYNPSFISTKGRPDQLEDRYRAHRRSAVARFRTGRRGRSPCTGVTGCVISKSAGSPVLSQLYEQWWARATKSELERTYLDTPQSHGELFSSLVREHVGIETEARSAQSTRLAELEQENRRLRQLLRSHGISDQEFIE